MLYKSTRGYDKKFKASEAVIKGLCDDGGLFVPESFPTLSVPIEKLSMLDYKETAYVVLKEYFTDYSEEELRNCINKAYDSKFDTEEMAPLVKKGDKYFLELFHGKTIAFKDMALSILPHLLTTALKKNNIWVYGAHMEGESCITADLSGAVALVIGSEGKGISKLTKEKCDKLIKIPMVGEINSLNASVAAGIIMYEVMKTRL